MSKHTPGPWNLYPNSASDWVVRKMFPDGQESHEIARCTSGMDNARLISAAPDLLEALEFVIRGVPDTWEGVQKARAAIAKARGEK
jgi:hypothetical protein